MLRGLEMSTAGARHPVADPGGSRQFPPILDTHIAAFIANDHAQLHTLVRRWGSPLNIVWPHTVAENADAMRGVLEAEGIKFAIFYGAKVNKSQAILRAAVASGIGVDVSSLAEFEDALRAGADPARICATGPAKTAAFHQALVAAGSIIAVDSLEELADLEAGVTPGQTARVLLRLRPSSEGNSRFGMEHGAVIEALRRSASGTRLTFEGLHAHLASYAVEDRIAAMAELAALSDAADGFGLATSTIDIGGGMPIRYVAPDVYAAALRRQRPEDYRTGRVPDSFYPYGSERTVRDWLAAFLSAPFRRGTIAGYFRDSGRRLAIEPGRSLVDQSAISLFRVTRVKQLGDATAVVFVEGSSFSACETWCNSEFLVDPILLPASPSEPASGAVRAYIAGHSCLGDDVVTNRFIDFSAAPRSGDLLVYANTAGYQMDLLENEFHRHPMPVRLTASLSATGAFVFVPDR